MTDMEPIVIYMNGQWHFQSDEPADENRPHRVIDNCSTVGELIRFVGREQAGVILQEYANS